MSCPQFSVIIPTYNRADFVTHAIESVLRQTFQDFEIIVIDDGSSDHTQSVLRYFGDRIRLISQSNQGVSSARNAGVAVALGRWLAFLDSDDEWHPTYLAVQDKYLSGAAPRVIAQCTDSLVETPGQSVQRFFEINSVLLAMGSRTEQVIGNAFSFVILHAPWQLGSIIIDADFFRRIGGFNCGLLISEDLDLLARLAALGPIRLISEPLVDIRRRQEVTEALTLAASRQEVQTRETHDRIWSALAGIRTLSARDRWNLRTLRSANKRALGNHLAERGNRVAALRAYFAAVVLAPSPKSIGKLIVALVRRRT